MPVRGLFAAVLVAVVVGATSCGGQSTPLSSAGEPGGAQGNAKNIEVEVVSRMFMDGTVYLVYGGGRQRLGSARGMSTTTFGVQWDAAVANASDAQLIVEPVGTDRSLTSSSFRLVEGGRVVWTIQGHQYNPPSELSLQTY